MMSGEVQLYDSPASSWLCAVRLVYTRMTRCHSTNIVMADVMRIVAFFDVDVVVVVVVVLVVLMEFVVE